MYDIPMDYEYIVIGAGAAGLSFSALMEKKGHTVALLEAHSLPGGCASYFERNGNIFDVGATTLSGLKPGRSLDLLIKELELNLDIRKIDPGLISCFKGKNVRRYSDQTFWMKELESHFPQIDHRFFWELVKKIDDDGWKLSSDLKNIPLRTPSDLLKFKFKNISHAMKLFPYFLKSPSSYLTNVDDADYKVLINEILFITAQNNLDETPMLMGAMGLNYPSDTGYTMGGMKAFSEALAQKCSNLLYRHQVLSISPIDQGKSGFIIQTSKGSMRCKKVVSTLPIWNHEKLFEGNTKVMQIFQDNELNKSLEDCWSAFTIYLSLPLDNKRQSLYYQIHCTPIPNCGTQSFFVSLSHPEDLSRSASRDRQVVTISTHTKPSAWMNLSKDEYKKKKDETTQFILKELCRQFSLSHSDLTDILSGSPNTFIKYTKRTLGLVGGIPHSIKRNPLKLVFNFSQLKNFYLIGDTQFPGQGIGAVVLGAQNLVDHLDKSSTKL